MKQGNRENFNKELNSAIANPTQEVLIRMIRNFCNLFAAK
jgi:hypothetical protein